VGTLGFFALVGLRLAAVYPAALGANWIFRLTETPGSTEYAAGVRRAAVGTVVLPLLGLLAIPYAVLWGPLAAGAHVALALAVALVTSEWLFLGFPKIPFTCTYQPGKANLRVTWPKYFAIFVVYCGLLPSPVGCRRAPRPGCERGAARRVALLVLARAPGGRGGSCSTRRTPPDAPRPQWRGGGQEGRGRHRLSTARVACGLAGVGPGAFRRVGVRSYRILGPAGRGGMASVYRARDPAPASRAEGPAG
jgi:hypothetical protein